MVYRCDAVLFDLDGTLVDSRIACENLVRGWAARHGLDADVISAVAQGRRNRDIAQQFTPHLPADEEGKRLDEEELQYRDGNVAIAGAAEILSGLPLNAWALVTSASRRVAEMRLDCAGLRIPSVLISSDDVSKGKPEPEGYLLAAAWLSVAPEHCLVVEDTPAGLEAARRAGMQALGITTTFSRAELNAAACIENFSCVTVTECPAKPRIELRVTGQHV